VLQVLQFLLHLVELASQLVSVLALLNVFGRAATDFDALDLRCPHRGVYRPATDRQSTLRTDLYRLIHDVLHDVDERRLSVRRIDPGRSCTGGK